MIPLFLECTKQCIWEGKDIQQIYNKLQGWDTLGE